MTLVMLALEPFQHLIKATHIGSGQHKLKIDHHPPICYDLNYLDLRPSRLKIKHTSLNEHNLLGIYEQVYHINYCRIQPYPTPSKPIKPHTLLPANYQTIHSHNYTKEINTPCSFDHITGIFKCQIHFPNR